MTHTIKGKKLSSYKFHKLIKISSWTKNVISKDLSQDPPEPNHFFNISPKLGKELFRGEIDSLYEFSLVRFEDSSGIKVQHSVHITAQVCPWKGIKI